MPTTAPDAAPHTVATVGAKPAWAQAGAPSPSSGAFVAPALAIIALAGVALYLRRRTPASSRYIQVLETTSLGPKRSLVVARLGDETLVLGTSEAGITVLATRPYLLSPTRAGQVEQERPSEESPEPQLGIVTPFTRLKAALSRPRTGSASREEPGFEGLLRESAEDEELRRKLAQGRSGRIS